MLQQTINEQLKAFDEWRNLDDEALYSLDEVMLKEFLSRSMRRAVEVALEETQVGKRNLTMQDEEVPTQYSFKSGFNQAVAEQQSKITKFLEHE